MMAFEGQGFLKVEISPPSPPGFYKERQEKHKNLGALGRFGVLAVKPR
jgi:hypothetical protein